MPKGIKDLQPIHVHVPTTAHQEDERLGYISGQGRPYETYREGQLHFCIH